MIYARSKKFGFSLTIFALLIFLGSFKSVNRKIRIYPDAIVGHWLLGSGKTRLTIYCKNGTYEGKIVWSRAAELTTTKPLPAKGEVILTGLRFNLQENKWDNGQYIDPNDGKIRKCKIRMINEKKLLVITYKLVPLLGRTDTWYKVKIANPEES